MLFSIPTEKIIEKEQRQIYFRRIFRRIFLEDWGTKLIALAITAALWIGVTGLRAPISITLKPVLITRISNQMELISRPTEEISIVVTGDKRKVDQLIARVNSRDLVASIDLTDVKSGDHTVQLLPETVNFDLPSGFKIVKIEPGKIAVKLERLEEKDVAVKVNTEGNPAEGYEIYATSVNPSKVRVRGAESFIKSLDSVSTEKININDFKDSYFARQVGLNVLNPRITLLETIVDVNLRIGPKRIEKTSIIGVKFEDATTNVTLVLLGTPENLTKLKVEDIKVELTRNGDEVIPRVTLPDEFENLVEVRKVKVN